MTAAGVIRQPRGRLPARVYWFRRVLVLATLLALIFAIARLVVGGDGPTQVAGPTVVVATSASQDTDAPATPAPAVPTSSAPAMAGPVPLNPTALAPAPTTPDPAVEIEPTGSCAPRDVTAVPSVPKPVAGRTVKIDLALTATQPACTFAVSPESLVVKVTSGKDRIWSTQECPAAVPRTTVTVRNDEAAQVTVTWSGRRSDPGCTRSTDWALPGYYHAAASVSGSEPADTQFHLAKAPVKIITRTITPDPKPKKGGKPTKKVAAEQPTAKNPGR